MIVVERAEDFTASKVAWSSGPAPINWSDGSTLNDIQADSVVAGGSVLFPTLRVLILSRLASTEDCLIIPTLSWTRQYSRKGIDSEW